jgi:hypothetical protein
MNHRVIEQSGNWRIVEIPDPVVDLDDLKGDVYSPDVNWDADPQTLAAAERSFEAMVQAEGVYGYRLERWNPEVGHGWEHIDSCWGFIGAYRPDDALCNHYIVDEFRQAMNEPASEVLLDRKASEVTP